MKIIHKLLIIFTIIITFLIFNINLKAASFDVYIVKYKCKVRTSPSDEVGAIKNGNDDVSVIENQELEYIKTVKGPNNGKQNQDWYAVKFDYAAREYSGYVAKACMYDVKTYSYTDDDNFENQIKDFPDSYKKYIRKLHAIHPNWTFNADYTNLDWESAAEAESEKGTSAISYLYPSLIFKDSMNPNGIVVDGTSWYAPAKDAVKYYMDPRNFLTEKNIFMFQSLAYNQNEDSSVQKLLDGSFMAGSFLENGISKTYANAFIEAASANNISSTYLAALALQEMGVKMSSAASGTVEGYEGFYNFYNIGATSGEDNYLKGLQYAKDKGWNSIQKAITGGASFIASNYINKGQSTIYFKKFNVSSKRTYNPYTHQYQTNIMAPEAESSSIYKSYKNNNKLDNNYNFIIPVYNNRPASAFKVSRTDTVGGSTIPTETEIEGNTNNNNTNSNTNNNNNNNSQTITVKPLVISSSEKIKNAGFNLSNNYVTKLSYGMDVSSIRNKISDSGITNSSGATKTTGSIATGDYIFVGKDKYEAVIYGDVSGDGKIDIKDLLVIQKTILKDKSLSGSYKLSADVSKDGTINALDLLLVQKHILGSKYITQ